MYSRDEFTKIYTRSHKMSFINLHILRRLKALYGYSHDRIEELVKAEQMRNFFRLFAACKHIKGTLINAQVEI